MRLDWPSLPNDYTIDRYKTGDRKFNRALSRGLSASPLAPEMSPESARSADNVNTLAAGTAHIVKVPLISQYINTKLLLFSPS